MAGWHARELKLTCSTRLSEGKLIIHYCHARRERDEAIVLHDVGHSAAFPTGRLGCAVLSLFSSTRLCFLYLVPAFGFPGAWDRLRGCVGLVIKGVNREMVWGGEWNATAGCSREAKRNGLVGWRSQNCVLLHPAKARKSNPPNIQIS